MPESERICGKKEKPNHRFTPLDNYISHGVNTERPIQKEWEKWNSGIKE